MYIKVKVFPNSKKQEIQKKSENSFIVYVKEPAERNLANKKVCQVIAEQFKIPEKLVRIINGHHSPSKLISLKI